MLGGNDSASAGEVGGRCISTTDQPQALNSCAAADPAGPAPITHTSQVSATCVTRDPCYCDVDVAAGAVGNTNSSVVMSPSSVIVRRY